MSIKNNLAVLLSIGMTVVISSCASVQFYHDSALTQKTGLPVYQPKPYLLVEYQTTKTGTVKSTVVYLPDLSTPLFVSVKPGIGSSALKMSLENGILTSYGLTTDTKMPDALSKVTDLLTKSTTSIAGLVNNKTEDTVHQPAFELYEIVIANGHTQLVPVK